MEEIYNTLNYYNKNAKMYFDQTIEGNMQENYDRFLSKIPKNAYILDFGCGSGRDSKYFIEHGYKVRAIDGSKEMCKLASSYINQNVECMKFGELNDLELYDAIWACSSILHVEKENLQEILNKMVIAIKPNGIIYTSFKKGQGYEIRDGKYYNYITIEELENIIERINQNVKIIDYYETLSSTKRPTKVTWSNFLMKKFE